MENSEQAKILRDQGLYKYMDDNKTLFTTDVPMTTVFGKLKISVAKELVSAAATETNNTGFSAEKLYAKSIACEMASLLGSRAKVQFGNLNERVLFNSIHGGVSYYYNASDATSGARLQELWNGLNTNVTLLTVDYMTPAQITVFGTKIAAFVELGGTATSVNVISPVCTAEFKNDLKNSSALVKNIKDLGKNFKISNPTFFNGLNYACKIPPYPVHHTPVNFLVTDSVTGEPIEFVASTLSISKLTPTSNEEGLIAFPNVRAGKTKATFAHKDYITGSLMVNVCRGVANNFIFKMIPIIKP